MKDKVYCLNCKHLVRPRMPGIPDECMANPTHVGDSYACPIFKYIKPSKKNRQNDCPEYSQWNWEE
jgi:hypothetical protein